MWSFDVFFVDDLNKLLKKSLVVGSMKHYDSDVVT